MSEQIPVTFLCAIHRSFGFLESDGVIIDAPKGSYINDLVEDHSGIGLFEISGLHGVDIPDKPGLYRYDGIATPINKPHIGSFHQRKHHRFTGKFTPIMIPRDDWFEQGVE